MNCKNRRPLRLQKYSFSIKIRKTKDCKSVNYVSLLNTWKPYGVKICEYVFELDKLNRLHLHGILLLPIGQRYTDLVDSKLHSYKFVKILTQKQEDGWLSYMEKAEYEEPIPEDEVIRIPRRPLFKSFQSIIEEGADFRDNFSDTEWQDYCVWSDDRDYPEPDTPIE